MILPVGPPDQQSLVHVEQHGGKWTEQPFLACRFVKLIGRSAWPESGDVDAGEFDQ
jgi:hypothetical protein